MPLDLREKARVARTLAEGAVLRGREQALRARNRRQPRILVYADSRGRNLRSRTMNHRSGSHIAILQRELRVDCVVYPYYQTTLLDFLNFACGTRPQDYAAVVLHVGVVDFSPRHLASFERMRADKAGMPGYDALFAANADYHADPWPVRHRGQPTTNLYSERYLEEALIPRLLEIPRLVWISSNPFVRGWEGESSGRPANIGEVVGRYDRVMSARMPTVVDLRHWTDDEVRRYTTDNIHFTREGFRAVAGLLRERLDAILG
jgi:hypothetical protein